MINICILNGSRLLGSVMAAALSEYSDLRVVGTATHSKRLFQLLVTDTCDVLIVAPNLVNEDAKELVAHLTSEETLTHRPKILLVGIPEEPRFLIPYFEAGVAGYVLRSDTVNVLVDNIRAIHAGRALVSPEMAAALLSHISDTACNASQPEQVVEGLEELTPREKEVLELIGQGLSNKEIGDRLIIELGTVKNHVHSILEKLDAPSRHAAAEQWQWFQDGLSS
jgi:DNA-binding NarL/FixJ family response regulator